jgi:hypothetical protein
MEDLEETFKNGKENVSDGTNGGDQYPPNEIAFL